MRSVFTVLLLLPLFVFPGSAVTQQNTDEPLFTISVAPPTSAKDLQLRYFVSGKAGVR